MLSYHRRIRDNLHGSVAITALEDRVINHPYMQRLRYIRQLGFFHLVFPGAHHTRFEHSLGVMEVATRCYHQIKDNQKRLLESLSNHHSGQASMPEELSATSGIISGILSNPYALQCLRLAALLHDIGHNPYSHCAEHLLPSLDEVLSAHRDLPTYLIDGLSKWQPPISPLTHTADHCEDSSETSKKRGHDESSSEMLAGIGSHEIFTLLLAWRVLNDVIGSILQTKPQKTQGPQKIPVCQISTIRDVLSLLSKDIDPDEHSPLREEHLRGTEILSDILSGDLDADRMDYLMRDSQQAGVHYGIFDGGRLRDCLCVTYGPSEKRFYLSLHEGGLAAFEDFLTARQSMFRQLYFHKTSVASEAMMQYIARHIGGWRFPSSVDAYASLVDEDLRGVFHRAIENQEDLNMREKSRLHRINDGLFRSRRLWKRVYERHGGTASQALDDPSREELCTKLKSEDIAYELVVSANYLACAPHTKVSHRKELKVISIPPSSGMISVVPLSQALGDRATILSRAVYIVRVYAESSETQITSGT